MECSFKRFKALSYAFFMILSISALTLLVIVEVCIWYCSVLRKTRFVPTSERIPYFVTISYAYLVATSRSELAPALYLVFEKIVSEILPARYIPIRSE